MVFNSYIFILVFFPLVTLGYFLLNKISSLAGRIFLVIANILFYLYGGWKFMVVTCVSVLVNILLAFLIKKLKHKKAIYIVGIVVNIVFLFAFKYVTPILSLAKVEFTFFNILLPLGISYYTFQQIAFLSSLYKEEIERFNVIDYLVYILFFPKVMMGPLIEYKDFVEQLNDSTKKNFNLDNFLKGIKMFAFGLFKKVVFADLFAIVVSYGFSNVSSLSSLDVFVLMISFTFQIYFDFSGYSDMAVGISMVLNFDLPPNFDSPYKAVTFRDFWKRWHISLTKFLTKYIYIPLGGNRKGVVLTCVNVLIVFLISGIWHGANFTFILWGAIWGVLCVIDRFIKKPDKTIWKILGWIIVFFVTNILWLLFRADSVSQWAHLVKTLFTPTFKINKEFFTSFESGIGKYLIYLPSMKSAIIAILIFVVSCVICFVPNNNYQQKDKVGTLDMVLSGLAITTCLMLLFNAVPFLYSGF